MTEFRGYLGGPIFNVSNLLWLIPSPLVHGVGAKIELNWEQKLASFR